MTDVRRLSTTVIPKIVHLGGRWATVAVAFEWWSDGAIQARIVGCSVYGEARTQDEAVESLEESLEAFAEDCRKHLAAGTVLSGQVAKDWQILCALFNVGAAPSSARE